MAKIYSLNPALTLRQVIPDGIYNSSEGFIEFLKAYYEWLHTTELTYEISSGTFQKNEDVVGSISKNTATINYIKSSTCLVVVVTGNSPFEIHENIVGETSGAIGILTNIKDNVLRKANQILSNRDVDKSIDVFSEYLKDELYSAIPSSYTGDKRLLAKKIRDYYQSKGHERSYKFFMKLLYDQDVEIAYPGDEILRVSDGNFVKETVIRARIIGDDSSDEIFDFLFKTIKGRTSGSIANVIDIKKIYIGSQYLAEMRLALVSGTFIADEAIYDLNATDGFPLETTIFGIIPNYDIVYGGSGYEPGDILTVSGSGQSAALKIAETYRSGIDSIQLAETGYGYRIGAATEAENTGSGGTGLTVIVSDIANTYTVTDGANTYTVGDVTEVKVVNKGQNYFDIPTIVLKDSAIFNLGMISDKNILIIDGGDNFKPGENIQIDYGNYTSQANAEVGSVQEPIGFEDYNIYLEDGDGTVNKLLFEDDDYVKYNTTNTAITEWFGNGAITRIKMLDRGLGYNLEYIDNIVFSFPDTIAGAGANLAISTIMGYGANVVVDIANNSLGVGAVKRIESVNFGVDYANASVSSIGVGNEDAVIVPVISGSGITAGMFINDNGKIDYKKIQDSYFYQQYSYVIKSGIEISKYKNVLKKIIHPIGLEVFGEIAIKNNLNLRMLSDDIIKINDVLRLSLIINSSTDDTLEVFRVEDRLGGIDTVFADITIGELHNISLPPPLIEAYRYTSFNSQYGVSVYYQVEKEIKVEGTASVNISTNTVTGTNTIFLEYFSSGDEFVTVDRFGSTGTNRLLIDTVSSNTEMSIRIPPSANIVSADVYRLSI